MEDKRLKGLRDFIATGFCTLCGRIVSRNSDNPEQARLELVRSHAHALVLGIEVQPRWN